MFDEHLSPDIEAALFDEKRMPNLSDRGKNMLRHLRGHPYAPNFKNYSGHRLTHELMKKVRQRHDLLWASRHEMNQAATDDEPAWLADYAKRTVNQVPAWQAYKATPFRQIPTSSRSSLNANMAAYMPLGTPMTDLLCFSTSGVTGHPIRVPSTPVVAAEYLAYHQRALQHFGVNLHGGKKGVGVALVGYQQSCFTYVSVNPLMNDCGVVKLNLNPTDWRDAEHRSQYLDDVAPELITGDPVSLSALSQLPMKHRPSALISTSMALMAGLRESLSKQFECPVLDVYSMNEAGPIAVFDPTVRGYRLLQSRLHVEILDTNGRPVNDGELGEITVTGGFNPCLPLLRYRTGDYARLELSVAGLVLRDLQGRAPVRFKTASGDWINNVEVTQALAPFPLVRFALHQDATEQLTLRVQTHTNMNTLKNQLYSALQTRFGHGLVLTIERLDAEDKLMQYTSDLPSDHVLVLASASG
jgi:phenylacetate-CoA ligase